ncbi:MAG TPA: hypothetical protein VH985_03750 [Candidatus Binatia bacterium]|jgi:hypothetical protein
MLTPPSALEAPETNDIAKDNRGLLWVTDKQRGLDVVEYQDCRERLRGAVS